MLVRSSSLQRCRCYGSIRVVARSLIQGAIALTLGAQAPPDPSHAWQVPSEHKTINTLEHTPEARVTLDPAHVYTLAELIDLAESNNPETRSAWESAKAQAAEVGIARSALFPTLAAAAVALSTRQDILFGSYFARQTVELYQAQVEVDYLIFDFGARQGRIDFSRANLAGANFAFNDVHLQIIYRTTATYYRLLNAQGQEDAARADLANAQTVQQAVESRLANGLSTLPDVLEARSSTAQSEYELQSAIGAEEIARGDLLTAITASPTARIRVQPIDQVPVPETLNETVESLLKRALEQRPDLLARVEQLRGAEAQIRGARSAFLPTLNAHGEMGAVRAYGQQDQLPGLQVGPIGEWNGQLSLNWTLFTGGERRSALERALADRRRAEADINSTRDQIANEVWAAYSNTITALRRRQAAVALLAASTESYNSSLEAYRFGVRNLLDVVAAQRTLAQARATDVAARADVLGEFAALAFRTGDLLHVRGTPPPAPSHP